MDAVIYRPTAHILHCTVRIFPPTEFAYAYDATFSIGIFSNEHELKKWEDAFKRCLTHNGMELLSSEKRCVWPTARPEVDFDQSEDEGLPWEVAPALPQLALKRCFEKGWSRQVRSK